MKVTVKTESFEKFRERTVARAWKLSRGEQVESSRKITFESAHDLIELLSAERIRLVEEARKTPLSISALAVTLQRDVKAVRRDVATLKKFGVVRIREQINPGHGRVKIVEPVAKKVELQASF